jgi:hypothetical protein
MPERELKMRPENGLEDLICQHIRSDVNRRFLGRMQAFRVDDSMPQKFRELLGELDRAEQGSRAFGEARR